MGIGVAGLLVLNVQKPQVQRSEPPDPQQQDEMFINDDETVQRLSIISPDPDALINTDMVTINGKAQKESIVVVQSASRIISWDMTSDEFAVDFPLRAGENRIRITMYPDGSQINTQEKDVVVYYIP